jgi:uncharacterized membrane protein
MTTSVSESRRLERLLAMLLHYGTWLASAVIALGIAVASVERYYAAQDAWGMRIVKTGIALFILLPVVRVVVMVVVFVLERNYLLVTSAGLVLMIILLGFVLGIYMPSQMQGEH